MKAIFNCVPPSLASKILLWVIFISLFFVLFRPVVSLLDPVGYYAWARSILIDGDLDVTNEFTHYEFGDIRTTDTGMTHNQWPPGSSMVWLPAMGVVHGVLSTVDTGIPADGYSWPYELAASTASALIGFLAIWMSFVLARRYVGLFAATAATAGIWLATPFVFYQYHQPLMSHTTDAFINGAFIFVWLATRDGENRPFKLALLGLICAFAVAVRTQNGILLFVSGIDVFIRMGRDVWNGFSVARIRPSFMRGVWIILGFVLGMLPLIFLWQTVYGTWFINSYGVETGESLWNWRAPHVFDVLFSSNRGLFVWAPVYLLSVLGGWKLALKDRPLVILFGAIVGLQLYIVGSWHAWDGGDAFGPRFWLGLTPVAIVCLATLIDSFEMPKSPTLSRMKIGWTFGLLILVGWNFLLMLQYSLGWVPPNGTFDLGEMVLNQFLIVPHLVQQVLFG